MWRKQKSAIKLDFMSEKVQQVNFLTRENFHQEIPSVIKDAS
jgi:hypothetical protein